MKDFYKRMADIELDLYRAFLECGDEKQADYHKQEYDNYISMLKD